MSTFSAGVLQDVPLTAFLKSVLAEVDASSADVSEAISLPPECYTSDEWFEFERRAIFDREWIALGHSALIPKIGDYFSISIMAEPLLVVRGEGGQIRILSAVCRHRGHILGEATGNAKGGFTCPFHGWSYALDGTLIAAPEMSGTLPLEELRRTQCLRVLRSEIWNGFIFVNLNGEAQPLAPRLKGLSREVRNHQMDKLGTVPTVDWPDNPWNWKLMQENAIEPYHTHYLHQGPHDFAPSKLASFVDYESGDDGAVFHPTGFLHIDGGFNVSGKCLLPPISTLTAAERQRVMFAVVPPNLFFGAQPDVVFYFVIIPQSAGKITLRVGLLLPHESLALPTAGLLIKGTIDGISIFNDADTIANTQTYRGMHSRFASRTRYAPKEKTLAQFNQWLVRRYKAYARDLSSAAHG